MQMKRHPIALNILLSLFLISYIILWTTLRKFIDQPVASIKKGMSWWNSIIAMFCKRPLKLTLRDCVTITNVGTSELLWLNAFSEHIVIYVDILWLNAFREPIVFYLDILWLNSFSEQQNNSSLYHIYPWNQCNITCIYTDLLLGVM